MSQHNRTWTPEALALFALYRDRREPHRPLTCDDGERCWVRDGPPSMSRRGPASHCAGCGGRPRSPLRGNTSCSPLSAPGRARRAKLRSLPAEPVR